MRVTTVFLIFAFVFGSLLPANAQSKREPDSSLYRIPNHRKDLLLAYREAEAAARIFREVMEDPEESIPPYMLDQSELIAVIPTRKGHGIKFEDGAGLVSVRDQQTGQWGAPIFIKIDGGRYEDVHHEDEKDLILLGLNLGIAENLQEKKFKIDREVGALPGPIGKEIEPQPGWFNNTTGFAAYLHDQESLRGVAISGAKIKVDKDLMEEVYGKETFNKRIKTFLPASQLISSRIMIFPETIDQYSKRPGV